MGYLGLLVVVLLGAGIAGYQSFGVHVGVPASIPAESGIKNVLDSARDAALGLEGKAPELLDVAKDAALNLQSGNESPAPNPTPSPAALSENKQTLLVAGGCFWCVEADLEKLPGVLTVVSGYAGGTTYNPTYQNYAAGGHKEVVEVSYDANRVSFEQILIYAMKHMDPTDDDGSFADRGEYYSPAFYYQSPEQKTVIENLIAEVNDKGPYEKDLAIDVEATPTFYPAEAYHQDYYKGTLSKLKYSYYRAASGRDAFIKKWWGTDTGPTLPWRTVTTNPSQSGTKASPAALTQTKIITMWKNYIKPADDVVKTQLSAEAYTVTQKEGTERSGTSPLDKNYERGIYVDVLSGEPLFSSRDKFDSGTGWPSFVTPISPAAVVEKVDKGLFTSRTEIRSAIADNHLGHVFTDGPIARGGLRYCMNGVALRFIAEADMDAGGYSEFKSSL